MKQQTLSHEKTAGICRSFSLLLQGGIGLADAAFLLNREETGTAAEILETVGRLLDDGYPLSEAMAQSNAFPGYVPGLLRMGEETGHLEEALALLAEYYEEHIRASGEIRRALAWPCMVLVLMLVVVGVLLVKVLPVFDRVYASLGSRLTGAAAGLLRLGQGLQSALPVLLVFLAAVLAAVLAAAVFPSLRRLLLECWLRRFGDRGIARRFNNARFAQGMAMALASGMAVDEAMDLARLLLRGIPGALQRVDACSEALRSGISLPDALSQSRLLPPSAYRLLAVAERGGNADRVMETIARQLMNEARGSLQDAAARVEPALVLATSALVGLVLLSAMLPLMNIMAMIG